MIRCNFCMKRIEECKCEKPKVVEFEKKIVEYEYKQLKEMRVTELKKIAKEKKIRGYSKMKEEELINSILGQS